MALDVEDRPGHLLKDGARMTRGRIGTVVSLGVVICLVVAYIQLRMSLGKVRSAIDSHLPKGTDAQHVTAFLDSIGIVHGPIRANATSNVFLTPTRLMAGSIAGTRVRMANPLADGIFLVFQFDDSDHFLSYTSKYGYTGP